MDQNNKAFLLEGQLLHQIRKQQARQKELDRQFNADPRELTPESYKTLSAMCYGAITQLMIVLTCHDNGLSNFLAEEKKESDNKKSSRK